jgi:hypothetical protein
VLRDRLLEGFVVRVARSRDADAFALRGGMLVRSWTDDAARPIGDVDLVCHLPFHRRDLRARLRAILADRGADDGVVFDADRFRIDASAPGQPQPGLTLFAIGEVDGAVAEIAVDVAFELEVWPPARRQDVGAARLWVCPHEMVIGTKLRVLAELGPRAWRPKDLGDVWSALRRFPHRDRLLGEALERCFARATLPRAHDPRTVLAAPWWRERHAQARWRDHAAGASVPAELDAAIGEVRAALAGVA